MTTAVVVKSRRRTTEEKDAGIIRWICQIHENLWLADVNVNEVKTPPYQRDLSTNHQNLISKSAAETAYQYVAPPELSFRDGSLWKSDGQHRISSMIESNLFHNDKNQVIVRCHVYLNLSYTEEAGIYADKNSNSKRNTAWDTFRARLESGRERERVIRREVSKSGLTCYLDQEGKKADLKSTKFLLQAYAAGIPTLREALKVLKRFKVSASDKRLQKEAVHTRFQVGLLHFLIDWDFTDEDFERAFVAFSKEYERKHKCKFKIDAANISKLAEDIASERRSDRACAPAIKSAFIVVFSAAWQFSRTDVPKLAA